MAFTQAQITALDLAIAEGALTVRYEDKQITYRTLDEMIRTRNFISQQLRGGTGPSSPASLLGGKRIRLGYEGGVSNE